MKKLLFALLLTMVAGLAYAGVDAEILDVAQDPANGSIIVRTQYKLDGVEVPSRYPVDAQGRSYWQTRYNVDKFAGMTDLQVKQYILKDLQSFGETLVRKAYFEKANFQYTQAKAALLIGTKGTIATADVVVDTNADGLADTRWVVKSDGTRTEEPYAP